MSYTLDLVLHTPESLQLYTTRGHEASFSECVKCQEAAEQLVCQ